jgi:putative transposase
LYSAVNYVHYNPIKHELVEKITDWCFTSASDFIEHLGREKAVQIWREYPILDMGEKWDD